MKFSNALKRLSEKARPQITNVELRNAWKKAQQQLGLRPSADTIVRTRLIVRMYDLLGDQGDYFPYYCNFNGGSYVVLKFVWPPYVVIDPDSKYGMPFASSGLNKESFSKYENFKLLRETELQRIRDMDKVPVQDKLL
jgi:hypothetical protein